MSSDIPPQTPETPSAWPTLNVNERRVLGVLIEKAKTTPDSYPLTLNALTTGCNQKSNRDPLLDLNDLDVEEALASCQKKMLAFKITGSRVDRWKHNLYETWKVNKVELAILGELLLRGGQTEGELRGRASRMEPIDDLEALRTALKPLAARGLIVYLTSEGRRGTTLTHGLYPPQELQRLRAAQPIEDVSTPIATSRAPANPEVSESKIAVLQEEVTSLRGQVSQLQTMVETLNAQLQALKNALGA